MTPESSQATQEAAPLLSRITSQPKGRVVAALAAGVGVLALLFILSDTRKLLQAASAIDLWLLILPLTCGLASYILMALSYYGIAAVAGARVPFWEMVKITFVANTANYVVSTGGLSGFALRLYFFLRLSIPSGTAVIISLVQTFVTNLILLVFVIGGFSYLLSTHSLHGYALGTTAVLLCLFAVAAAVAMLLLLHRSLRRRTLFLLAETLHWFLHRFLPRHKPARMHIWRYQANLNRGIEFLLLRKRHMVVPTLWIVADWMVTIFVLYGAFVAVRYPIPLTYVVVGFAVGIILSLVSFVPGGLGVMEGSMAAIFSSMAVPFETAVVAVLIFRVAYYIVPMIVSLFFFRQMLGSPNRQATHLQP